MSGRDEGGEGRGGEGRTREGRGLVGHSKDVAFTLREVGATGGFEQRRDVTQVFIGSLWLHVDSSLHGARVEAGSGVLQVS